MDGEAPLGPASGTVGEITSSNDKKTDYPTNDKDAYLDNEGNEVIEKLAQEQQLVRSSTREGASYQAINPGDEDVLTRIATHMSRSKSYAQFRRSSTIGDDHSQLERKGTLEGIEIGDPILDPTSDKFDITTWVKMSLELTNRAGLKKKRAGVVFKDVEVRGRGSSLNVQSTVGSVFATPLRIPELVRAGRSPEKQILRNFDGILKSGELLVVLGRPGSGCSTLLKTITGEMHGLELDHGSTVHYNGVDYKRMHKEFRGEVIYNQEVDKHFPHLTVGQTLEHAAALRLPRRRAVDIARQEVVKHVVQVVMAVYGLSHTYNTKVGDDYVRGVSGGERKRVSIAEMALAGSPISAWDNSTRGLDSATALSFVRSIRQTADIFESCHAVAIYQASQSIYDLFDKAVVLYEGKEIYFGPANEAKAFFEEMGWYCPPRQTTGDFLTSITNPAERQARDGYEEKVPRTSEDFEAYWRKSDSYANLHKEIEAHEQQYPIGDSHQLEDLRSAKHEQQAKHARPRSPYVVSVGMQVRLNTKRAFQRVWNDPAATFTPIVGNIIMSLIISSVFFDTPNDTASFTAKGAVLFFAILLNALSAISEINNLYSQRPIVEKHKSYAFYHPFTEAFAGIVLDIPLKFFQAVAFNVILYFMSGLRREPSQFFIFFLVTYVAVFAMSAIYRTLASVTKTISQAMSLAGLITLALVIYTAFLIRIKSMKPWFSWIRFLNPVFFSFEMLVANEFHGREFACSQFVPNYPQLQGDSFICSSQGAIAGERTVNGERFIQTSYSYFYSHVWRNLGILLAFLVGFMAIYFVAVELNSSTSSTAEVLVFRRGHVPKAMKDEGKLDEESGSSEKEVGRQSSSEDDGKVTVIPRQTDNFTFRNVCYDIEVKDGTRRLLDNVSAYVRPGTLTALMGTSGAGKTTLLDVLAQRASIGVITGDMLVNGKELGPDFQRKTGYVQQQDLHLATATVRESLQFSAMLRQPKSVSRKEKYEYVEDVIKMLNMEEFSEAVVGVPGEGLNVEQRKLLTIGVELAAKPQLLIFLDEPTSGLDSQSSWSICSFLRKLADNGQAVLCTIHQPSAILFQTFDRLLFLRAGGKTVYFGNIGENSRTLLDYFENNGARECDSSENPAEYMLEIAADEKWVDTWKNSEEAKKVQTEIDELDREKEGKGKMATSNEEEAAHTEFAMPFTSQLYEVTWRVAQQYWRMPSYILSKFLLSGASGLFIGFSFFQANSSQQGMQQVLYSLFMVTTIFSSLVQQIMPLFVTQRSLYEVRERPSKAYSWKAFLIAQIVIEWPYQIIAGVLIFATFYYPVVGIQDSERQGLVLLLAIVFMLYGSTFAHMCIAALPDAQTAGSIVTILFSMTLIFNGVMQPPSALPGFWIFMYRVSPLTYWVGGLAAAMLHGRKIVCSPDELSVFNPPTGMTCGDYLGPFLQNAPGTLQNPGATSQCSYCSLSSADQFLNSVGISWDNRWRNFGLIWVYVGFNIFAAVFLYWFFRVRSTKGKKKSFSFKGVAGKMVDSVNVLVHRVLLFNKSRVRSNKKNANVI